MQNVNLNCGVISNFFTVDTVSNIVKTFARFPLVEFQGAGNLIRGIDSRHLAYPWFDRIFMQPVRQYFNRDIKIIYGMLLDCHDPFDVHEDLKPIPDPLGHHYLSFLAPLSVDHDRTDCSKASTIIFNETMQEFEQQRVLENNALSIRDQIPHVTEEYLPWLSVKHNAVWHAGDLIWWDSRLAHVSNDFRVNGVTSKQAIVIHTYVLPD